MLDNSRKFDSRCPRFRVRIVVIPDPVDRALAAATSRRCASPDAAGNGLRHSGSRERE